MLRILGRDVGSAATRGGFTDFHGSILLSTA